MFIHSDTLTQQDLREALPENCCFEYFTNDDGRDVLMDVRGSKSHGRRYEIRMSGTSKSWMDSRRMPMGAHSATWDEWGNFIAELFRRDIHAKIGMYQTLDSFIQITADERDRVKNYRPDLAATRSAPWLDDTDLIFASARGYYRDELHYTKGIGSGATHERITG